jgi:hypothetical protein
MKKNVFKLLVGKSEGKEPIGTARRKLVANVKMDIRESESASEWSLVDCIGLTQDRVRGRLL